MRLPLPPILLAALPLAASLAGCALPPRQPAPPAPPAGAAEVRAVTARIGPIVDGTGNDDAWRDAPETEVPLEGPGPRSCRLRACVHRGSLFLLLRWTEAPAGRDGGAGAAAIALPILGSREDRWEWDAARTDPRGFARDMVTDGAEAPRDDEGTPVLAGPPTGGAADVAGRGRRERDGWTVEFARALFSGSGDDRDLEGLREATIRVEIGGAGGTPSRSAPIRLRLP